MGAPLHLGSSVTTRRVRPSRRSAPAPRPFLKWAGGKSQLLAQYEPHFPAPITGTYHEPFLGGGALYFHLGPARAILSDSNTELILCYTVVRDHPRELIADLLLHEASREHYYQVRSLDPSGLDDVRRASRMIYLNKTCYNGLYRVNRKGQFNVPFGRYRNPRFCEPDNIRAVSRRLKAADLRVASFQTVLDRARRGDFVYFDPPYHPLSGTASFTAYTEGSFAEPDQLTLAEVFQELDERGCKVMLSNSDTPLVRRLYKKFLRIPVSATRAINSVATKRGKVRELLVLNYSPPGARVQALRPK